MLLSVIIPTRNRAHFIGRLLDSLFQQEPVSFKWEIVVVDNGSSDATAEIVKQKQSSNTVAVQYVHEVRTGLVHARHRGAEAAKGEILGFLDDDMYLVHNWILGQEKISQGQADAVVGRILPDWQTDPPKWLGKLTQGGVLSYLGLLDFGDFEKAVQPKYVFGGNCFLPKNLLFSLGGFHPDGVPNGQLRYRGDGETGLMAKFETAGLRSFYDPRATAYHIIESSRLTLEYVCSRAFNQGISDSYTHIRNNYNIFYSKFLLKRLRLVAHKIVRDRVQTLIHEAYIAGYKFHQNEVKSDPDLYIWVKKDSYFS